MGKHVVSTREDVQRKVAASSRSGLIQKREADQLVGSRYRRTPCPSWEVCYFPLRGKSSLQWRG